LRVDAGYEHCSGSGTFSGLRFTRAQAQYEEAALTLRMCQFRVPGFGPRDAKAAAASLLRSLKEMYECTVIR
jgi:hypothetical protein